MLFRKKKQKRPIFGFPCSPIISNAIRATALRLNTPYYPLAEHVCQLGLSIILTDLEDERFKERLVEHLVQDHLLVNKLDPDNEYDESAMAEAKKKQVARQEREQFIRSMVEEVEKYGMPPRFIALAVKLLVETALKHSSRDSSNRKQPV
jgi:hypothetical protein